ncbi:MAG: glycosyltransferase family 39 protein [Candidatus Eisenbacteria bacterium]|nr:glycosyltransferase family 39 protein [Candidatus Eisenbacteria bacterium]
MKFRASYLLAFLLPVAAILQLTSAARMSPTVDETHYVGVGRYLWETGDWSMKGAKLHPPLSYYLNSIPLARLDVPEDVWRAPHQDERGRRLFALAPAGRVVNLARAPTILITALLLLLVFVETRRLFGGRAAALALFLAALEPNLLAHGSLATQDMVLTLTLFLAVVLFRRCREKPGAGRLLLAGAALGAALLSKYTGLLLVGILPAAALLDRGGKRALAALLPLAAVALIVVHAGYLPLHLRAPEEAPRAGMGVLPAPYAEGIEYQRGANTGYPAFFFGRVSDRGWRAYYPVAFLVKTPIPFLLLAGAGALGILRRRDRSSIAWLLLPPLLLALFFVLVSRINIGLRYLLPVYPFLAVLGGSAAAGALKRRRKIVLLLLAAWLAAGTAIAWPHYLSYFNEACGGTRGGSRILSDSNLDWGQDLPGLARFLDERGDPVVYLSYFGTAEPHRYGIRYRWLSGWLYHPPREILEGGARLRPDPDWVAVSRMVLHGVRLPDPEMFRWLEKYPVVAEIGGSIVVFDLGGDPDAHLRFADIYRRSARRDYMEEEMRRVAQEEAPGRPRGRGR